MSLDPSDYVNEEYQQDQFIFCYAVLFTRCWQKLLHSPRLSILWKLSWKGKCIPIIFMAM